MFFKRFKSLTLNQPLSILISLSLIFPNFMLANIIADINAPKHNQPTILKTPNSAIQIDITKPTSKGVSINEYSKFNTSKDGTILNNSRINTNTKIGGLITANPRLSESSAKLIVNKVNSNEKSSLTGNIEIAGEGADLIIANPSGINIDGTHFINSKSTTLTTGNIEYENGGIKNIAVNKGEILITSRGLKDESNYLNILTHSAKINANIHANEINIITGDNTINKDGSILSNNENSIKTSKFSIDSSSLGGMYANKIKLIATKNGIGVNNAGVILANQININSNGDLINSGDIISNEEINIEAKNIKNEANLVSNSSLSLKAKNIDNDSLISSAVLDIKSNSIKNNDTLESIKLDLQTKFLSNEGLIYNYYFATINSDSIINKGKIYANNLEIYNTYDFINLNSLIKANNHLEIYTNNFISTNSNFLSKDGVLLSNNTNIINSNLYNTHIYTKLFFNKNSKFENLNIIDKVLKTNSNLFIEIFQDNLNIKEKEEILSKFMTSYAKNFGYSDEINVVLLDTYEIGANNSQFLGNFNTATPNSIYINLAYINNPVKLTKALGHELYHLISFSKGNFIPNDKEQDILANHQGYLLTYYLNESLKDKKPLYKYQDTKANSYDKKVLYNEEFFNELDKYSSDNVAPVVISLGARVVQATFRSSFVKKISKEAIDKLTKSFIRKCVQCHDFDHGDGLGRARTGPLLKYDLSKALEKDEYHSKFMKKVFIKAGIKFNNSDLIEHRGVVNVGPVTIEGDGGKESKAGYIKNKKFITPDMNKNRFEKLKRNKAYKDKNDGKIWIKDMLHKNHWEVYKDKKAYEKGKRLFDVWDDGRLKGVINK
ncbi:filamentous hemagglutinin N-terminal domain-containing protein [Campylobacter sputorum]|uniref:filamentous hemagglutinin N-terminal domain-containing protein n=1 Tax=Campylobacter sputorum TaxID=206 RepID=UPI000B79895E|nr:filamentous hemagglutinin N-terminal domain-containing protein [Campylobacter sputorum]